MTSLDIKAYIVELGEIDHKPCWSIRVSLLKVGFWEKLICVKAMAETLSLVSPWQAKSITQHWRRGTFWSTEPVLEDFDEMLTCRKARFLNGKTSIKLFALFSFWVDVFILYIFHILYIPLHTPQKDCQLLTKKEPITDWMIIVSRKTENSMWVNRFCCLYTDSYGSIGQ